MSMQRQSVLRSRHAAHADALRHQRSLASSPSEYGAFAGQVAKRLRRRANAEHSAARRSFFAKKQAGKPTITYQTVGSPTRCLRARCLTRAIFELTEPKIGSKCLFWRAFYSENRFPLFGTRSSPDRSSGSLADRFCSTRSWSRHRPWLPCYRAARNSRTSQAKPSAPCCRN